MEVEFPGSWGGWDLEWDGDRPLWQMTPLQRSLCRIRGGQMSKAKRKRARERKARSKANRGRIR